jgi:hypothetical protein
MRDLILLERYKYIIDQKKRLNDATFKIAAFYQAVTLVIFGAQFKILETAQKQEISDDLARLGSWGLFWSSVGLTFVSLLLMIGGVGAWLDYRREEALMETEFAGLSRKAPSLKALLRWYETYISFTMIAVIIAYYVALTTIIIPTIS